MSNPEPSTHVIPALKVCLVNSPRISDPQPWRFLRGPAAYMRLDDDELVLLCPTLLKSVRVPGFCSGEGASFFFLQAHVSYIVRGVPEDRTESLFLH